MATSLVNLKKCGSGNRLLPVLMEDTMTVEAHTNRHTILNLIHLKSVGQDELGAGSCLNGGGIGLSIEMPSSSELLGRNRAWPRLLPGILGSDQSSIVIGVPRDFALWYHGAIIQRRFDLSSNNFQSGRQSPCFAQCINSLPRPLV